MPIANNWCPPDTMSRIFLHRLETHATTAVNTLPVIIAGLYNHSLLPSPLLLLSTNTSRVVPRPHLKVLIFPRPAGEPSAIQLLMFLLPVRVLVVGMASGFAICVQIDNRSSVGRKDKGQNTAPHSGVTYLSLTVGNATPRWRMKRHVKMRLKCASIIAKLVKNAPRHCCLGS